MFGLHFCNVAKGVSALVAAALLVSGMASPAKTSRRTVPTAVSMAMKLMTASGNRWLKSQRCISCHHQWEPMVAFAMASKRDIALDLPSVRKQAAQYAFVVRPATLDESVQGSNYIDAIVDGLLLHSCWDSGVKPCASIGALCKFDALRQSPDGSWARFDARPPETGNPIATTALMGQAFSRYLTPYQPALAHRKVAEARSWLETCVPTDNHGLVYRLFGLSWTGSSTEKISRAVQAVVAAQRPDGGWSQLSSRESDPYESGLALVALHEAGHVSTKAAVYQRGIRYLLESQHGDGSWRVVSRIHPPAPVSPGYFESGFPYGHDQWVSMAGTAWASMALMETMPVTHPSALPIYVGKQGAQPEPWQTAAMFGSTQELQRLLDKGMSPNQATANGTTLLMMCTPDPAKMKLVLDRGAKVDSIAKSGMTALMCAASSSDGLEAVRLLLSRGAENRAGKKCVNSSTPFLLAVSSGDLPKAELLFPGAEQLGKPFVYGGIFPLTALGYAVLAGDTATSRWLLAHGADVESLDDQKLSLLDYAVLYDRPEIASVLLDSGAKLEYRDPTGMTPLLWACTIEHGRGQMVRLLLSRGADRTARTKQGQTAVTLAKGNAVASVARVLN